MTDIVEVYLVGTETVSATYHITDFEMDGGNVIFELDAEHHPVYAGVMYPTSEYYFKTRREVS
jgi:hypothetical protein